MTNEERRINWVKEALKALPAGIRLLDAGAGEQQYKKFCTHLQYFSQDFAAYRPDVEKEGLQMTGWDYGELDYVSDITTIPVESESFDVILCTEVFEHIPDPIAAIREFSRILKVGGQLIITAPFCSMTHFAPYHFYTGFNKYFYQQHLVENGFIIQELTASGNYFDYMSQELGRIPHLMSTKGRKVSWFHRWLFNKVKNICDLESHDAAETSELMCFGWHVRAVKQSA